MDDTSTGQISDKYGNALDGLPKDSKLLIELNKMILKYSVGGWKKEDFLKSVEQMDIAKKENGKSNLYNKESIKKLLKERGIKSGLSKYSREELIRLYFKDKFYNENKDELCKLDRAELVNFLDQFKDRLKTIITTIPEGNQALLKIDDIVDVDHGFHHKEASRELIYLSNPLYTLFTMITEHYHVIRSAYREQVETLTSYDAMEMEDEIRSGWTEYVPDVLDDMIRITYRTYNSIKKTSLEIMKIILAKLYDVDTLNHRANINPIVNIILHGNYTDPIFINHYPWDKEKFDYSLKLFQLLVNNGLEEVNIAGVRYDIILGERGIVRSQVNGKVLLSQMPFSNHVTFLHPAVLASLQDGGDARYYSICRRHLKDLWKHSRKLHRSKKRLNFALGTVDPHSPLNFIEESNLIESMGRIKPGKRMLSETMRRQHLIGDVQNKDFLTERRLTLGSAITRDESVMRDIPLEVLGNILTYLSKEHIPMPEQKISDILETIHERREFEKAFGPIEPEPEPEPEPLAIMDRVSPRIKLDEGAEGIEMQVSEKGKPALESPGKKKKKLTKKKKKKKEKRTHQAHGSKSGKSRKITQGKLEGKPIGGVISPPKEKKKLGFEEWMRAEGNLGDDETMEVLDAEELAHYKEEYEEAGGIADPPEVVVVRAGMGEVGPDGYTEQETEWGGEMW